MNLKDSLSYALDKTIQLGADKAEGGINQSEKKELNIEAGKMSLFRTTFQNSLSIEAIKDNKQSSVSINKVDKESIDSSIELLMSNVESSQADEANDISQNQNSEVFNKGSLEPDLHLMYDKLDEFNDYVRSKHKKIILEAAMLDHTTNSSFIMNSNGVDFEVNKGLYTFSPMNLGLSRIFYPDHYLIIFSTVCLFLSLLSIKGLSNNLSIIVGSFTVAFAASVKIHGFVLIWLWAGQQENMQGFGHCG